MVKILRSGFYIVVISVLFIIQFSRAQDDKTCKLNGSTGRVNTVNIDDQSFKQGQFDVENVESIGSNSNSEHFTLTFDKINNLFIWKFIDDTINDFDEIFDKTTSSPYTEEITAQLTCSDGSNNAYIIRIIVTDTNDHDPTIVKQDYVFTVPNPFPANLDITLLDDKGLIQVEDQDFSVQDITVDITNNDDLQFITEATQVGNSKRYTISLKFEKQTWLKSDANFQIVANNEGRLSTPATIQLKIDQANSVPDPPTFTGSKQYCECSYNEANPLETTCDLLEVTSNTDAEYDVTTDEDILDVSLDSSNQITIKLKGPINANKNVMIFNLKVSKKSKPSDATELPIIIQVPKVSPSTFIKPYYQATYTQVEGGIDTVTSEEIEVSNSNGVEVQVECKEKNFKLTQASDPSKYNLEVAQDLTEGDINKGEIYVVIQIREHSDCLSPIDSIPVIVKIPSASQNTVAFKEIAYSADYSIDDKNTVQIKMEKSIELNTVLTEDVPVNVATEWQEYFSVVNTQQNTWEISSQKPLDNSTIESKVSLVIILEGDVNAEKIHTALVLNLPKKSNDNGNGDDNDDDDCGDDHSMEYIIVIVILAILLVAGIIGVSIFYYKRYRNNTPIEEPETTPKFTKNPSVITEEKESKTSYYRRPTGIPFSGSLPVEEDNDEDEIIEPDSNNNDLMDRRKSVVFDENIEEMEIDGNDDDDDNEDAASSSEDEESEEEDAEAVNENVVTPDAEEEKNEESIVI